MTPPLVPANPFFVWVASSYAVVRRDLRMARESFASGDALRGLEWLLRAARHRETARKVRAAARDGLYGKSWSGFKRLMGQGAVAP